MKPVVISIVAVLALAAASAEKGTSPANADILGVWRGKMDGLPFITLTVTDEGGQLAGAILFYLVTRHEGKPPSSSPGIPEPLLNPRFDGKVLTFQVSHRRAHPGTQSDPPVRFRLKLTGSDKSTLIRADDAGSGIEMVREN